MRKKEKRCKHCDRVLKKNQNTFCNIQCYQEYRFENEYFPLFLEGKITDNKTLKKILIRLHDEECAECHQEPIWNNKPLVLQVDHIDGNSDNCKPENLRLLCPNCHSQQETTAGGIHNKKKTKRNKYLRNYKSSFSSVV